MGAVEVMPATVDLNAADAWFALVYEHCDPDEWLTLFAIDRETGERITEWAQVHEYEVLVAAADDIAERCCVWFGVATRAEKATHGRGGAKDCATLPALWVDIDIAGDAHQSDGLPPTLEAGRDLIAKYPVEPTAVVDSGHGLQAWWLFDEPLDVERGAEVLEQWAYTWQTIGKDAGYHVDNVFDMARIMRLPGTFNNKLDAKPVTITETTSARYGVDELDPFFAEAPPITEAPPLKPAMPYIGPTRPGDDFNAQRTCAHVLLAAGWVEHHTDSVGTHYTRPGKDKTQGASATVYPDDGHCIVWSDATKLEVRRSYDPYGLYVAWFHDGDFNTATRELRQQGYGSQPVDMERWIELQRSDKSETVDLAIESLPTLDVSEVDYSARFAERVYKGREIEKIPPPEWLIDDLLERDSLSMLFGPSGAGKSFIAIHFALAIATGAPYFGRDIGGGAAPVLYIVGEGGAGIGSRQSAWLDHTGHEDAPNLHWHHGAINLLKAEDVAGAAAYAEKIGARAIVVDTLHRCSVGFEESSAQDAGHVIAALDTLRSAGDRPTVLSVHHSGKDATKGARGSSALKGAMETELELLGDSKMMQLRVSKQKNAAEPDHPFTYKLQPVGFSAVLVSSQLGSAIDGAVVDILRVLHDHDDGNGISRGRWGDLVLELHKFSDSTFSRACKAAMDREYIAQERDRGPYRLTDEGDEFLFGLVKPHPEGA